MTKLESRGQCTVVVVGDSRVGKSALIRRFVSQIFEEKYMPTSFDKLFTSQEVNKHNIDFGLWDTSGSPSYDSVRPLSYQEAHVFLVCYKISDPISLYNVKNKWIVELRRHRPDVPVILCGCQADLRTDAFTIAHLAKTGRTPVSSEQALAICCEIEAVNYVETAAAIDKDVFECFEVCALAAIRNINNNSTFKRSPSCHSTMSLSDFKRSPSVTSTLSLGPNHKLIPSFGRKRASNLSLNSPTVSEKDFRSSAFSPEPAGRITHKVIPPADSSRIPPVISEHEMLENVPVRLTTTPPYLAHQRIKPRPNSLLFRTNEQQQYDWRQHVIMSPCSEVIGPIHPKRGGFDTLSLRSSISEVESTITSPSFDQSPMMAAQVRPNFLSRRTSYRTYNKVSIPVAAPMSPVGSECSFDIKSPNSQSSGCQSPVGYSERTSRLVRSPALVGIPVFAEKTYESLKSQTSTSSQSSKRSTDNSETSSISAPHHSKHLKDPSMPDTEDPELIKNLNFVSPKSGVYRPMPEGRRGKQNCVVM